ncbi:MAG: hypothetical protein WBQ79_11540 [Acidobacteriaceae bacterium]
MYALRKMLISIAVAFLAMTTAAASSRGVAHDVPEPDSISGFYWQRVIDKAHPAAPPHLIHLHDSAASFDSRDTQRPVACVRAGEHLLLHESRKGSSTLSLAAIALEGGVCGGRVRARIQVTGALTEITVLGPRVGVLDRKGDEWR